MPPDRFFIPCVLHGQRYFSIASAHRQGQPSDRRAIWAHGIALHYDAFLCRVIFEQESHSKQAQGEPLRFFVAVDVGCQLSNVRLFFLFHVITLGHKKQERTSAATLVRSCKPLGFLCLPGREPPPPKKDSWIIHGAP